MIKFHKKINNFLMYLLIVMIKSEIKLEKLKFFEFVTHKNLNLLLKIHGLSSSLFI